MKNPKTVLITGITKGLGKELLKVFDHHNWTLIGCSRTQEDIVKLQDELDSRHYFKSLDISNPIAVEEFRNEIIDQGLQPGILINNASIINQPKPVWKIDPIEFKKVIDINLVGSFNLIHCFLSQINPDHELKIINISSYWGKHGEAHVAPYCASKFGLEGLTLSLAKELPSNIMTVLVDPGVMQTEMLRQCTPEKEYMKAPTAEKRAEALYQKILTLKKSDNGMTIYLDQN